MLIKSKILYDFTAPIPLTPIPLTRANTLRVWITSQHPSHYSTKWTNQRRLIKAKVLHDFTAPIPSTRGNTQLGHMLLHSTHPNIDSHPPPPPPAHYSTELTNQRRLISCEWNGCCEVTLTLICVSLLALVNGIGAVNLHEAMDLISPLWLPNIVE